MTTTVFASGVNTEVVVAPASDGVACGATNEVLAIFPVPGRASQIVGEIVLRPVPTAFAQQLCIEVLTVPSAAVAMAHQAFVSVGA